MVTEGSWGPSTQWHHMQCTVFRVATAEEVEGFADLDDALQASEPRALQCSYRFPGCVQDSLVLLFIHECLHQVFISTPLA